ncbi:MAG: alpha-1,2-fucosyltransferase, partial [Phycisphaerales bacterium]
VRKWTATRRTGRPLVGVHVRRGDYLKRRIVDSVVHLSPSWYSAAAERLTERHGELEFVVVSDDPAWCRESLRLPGPMAIASLDHPKDPLEDLALLSRCDHHILANSTFSWWGARLAAAGGDVVAPTCWWIDPPIGREVLAEHWIALANSHEGLPIDRTCRAAVV